MNGLTNRELLFSMFEHENVGEIPKFLVGDAFIKANSGMDPKVYTSDPVAYVDANLKLAHELGLVINCSGAMMDIPCTMGKGLINRDGNPSANGEETIQKPEDMELLHDFEPEQSNMLSIALKRIKVFKEKDPGTPTMVLVDNSPMVASVLMGAHVYYRSIIRNKKFVSDMTSYVEPFIVKGLERLAEAGCDIIWFPVPTMGGSCVLKKDYAELCSPYSKRLIQKVHDLGMKAIIHTCGDWNDRFDLVMEENPDGIHLSEAHLKEFREEFGKQVCMMGNISVVQTLFYKNEEEIYDDSYESCMEAAQDGNYLIAPDCGIPGDLPPAKLRAMYRAADDASKKLFG